MSGLKKEIANVDKVITSQDSDAKKFNHNLILMMEQLKRVYPEDKDIDFYIYRINVVGKINAKIPSEMFLKFAQDHVDQLMTRDEGFFLDELDPQKVLTTDTKYLRIIYKVRFLWKTNDNPKLKDVLWKYFQVMLLYGIRCQKRHDLVLLVNKFRKIPMKDDF